MPMFHHLAVTDTIWLRTEPDNHYPEPVDEFQKDFGVPVPPLPEGIVQRIYEPKKRHALMNAEGHVVDGGPMPWPVGDVILERADTVMRAKMMAELREKEAITAQAEKDYQAHVAALAERDAKAKADNDAMNVAYYANRKAGLAKLTEVLTGLGADPADVEEIIQRLWPTTKM